MIAEYSIPVTRAGKSKLKDTPSENMPFGKYFTDHMLVADYEDGEWKKVEIVPYAPLSFEPSLAALHYGQAIFEGIKAYKAEDGKISIFRPYDNFKRFNISAKRMEMPEVPEGLFIEGMRQLISVDKDWIPSKRDHSLYIRPFMISTDEMIGVRPSEKYKFIIILCPTGPYYAAPMRIYVEEKYTRAAPGGVGFAKNAGNYGGSMHATSVAKSQGYDQVLWTDANEHKYVQEIGTMNVFFIIDGKAYTPDLESGTILEGVTRDSAITILEELGYPVIQGPIHIDNVIKAYEKGTLTEMFGTGTAATISMIKELKYQEYVMKFPEEKWNAALALKARLDSIRQGGAEDVYGWMLEV